MARRGAWPEAPEPLPVAVPDNHAHLEWPAGDTPKTVSERLADAAAVGVDRVVQVGCEIDSARWTAQAVEEHPALVGAVALHPNEVPTHVRGDHESGLSYEDAFAEIATLAAGPRIRAISETGLDYYRTGPEGHEQQKRAFRDHIALAKERGLAMQIHDRDAHGDVVEILDADGAPERTVFHCFSGDAGLAKLCVDRGWFVSFAGTVTFANAADLKAAAAVTPLEFLMVETDAPFLTPQPFRGRPNAPYLVPYTVREIARIKGLDVVDVCHAISATTESVYGPW